jgi:hypothetical protein
MSNEQKSDEENLLKTALTYGSAVARKNYRPNLSEYYQATVLHDNQCPINSVTISNQDWNNAERADTLSSLSSQNPRSRILPYNHEVSEWITYTGGTNYVSTLIPNHQQPMIPLTHNNPLSPERNDTNIEEAESNSPLSSNVVPNRHDSSSEKYQQQNGHGQNYMAYAQFNNHINNNMQYNKCIGPLMVPTPMMQCELTQHAIHRIEQKSRRGRKKKKLTYRGKEISFFKKF